MCSQFGRKKSLDQNCSKRLHGVAVTGMAAGTALACHRGFGSWRRLSFPILVSWEVRGVNTCYEELKEVSLSQSRSERAAKGKVNGKMLLQSFRFCSRSYNT